MSSFRLVIASPDGRAFDGEAACISVRGTEGELAVMAGHVPFMTAVRECDCVVELEDGTTRIGHTEGGLLTVSKEETTLLSGSFRWTEE